MMSSEARQTGLERQGQDGTLNFRFSWLSEAGEIVGFRRHSGHLEQEALELSRYRFPLSAVHAVRVHHQSLWFSVQHRDESPIELGIKPWGLKAELIKQRIDQWRSRHLAAIAIEQAVEESHDAHRLVECPHCQSTLMLTRFPATPQTYCEHCGSLFASDQVPVSSTQTDVAAEPYQICDRCGLFAPPHTLHQFYFYFLYVDYGLHFNREQGCRVCLRKDAWRMLMLNGPFLIGVPWSIAQLVKTYRHRGTSQRFLGIDSANLCAHRGDLAGALAGYSQIIERVDVCAGVKYNLAKCLESLGRFDDAVAVYHDALLDCSNYQPAIEGLSRLGLDRPTLHAGDTSASAPAT